MKRLIRASEGRSIDYIKNFIANNVEQELNKYCNDVGVSNLGNLEDLGVELLVRPVNWYYEGEDLISFAGFASIEFNKPVYSNDNRISKGKQIKLCRLRINSYNFTRNNEVYTCIKVEDTLTAHGDLGSGDRYTFLEYCENRRELSDSVDKRNVCIDLWKKCINKFKSEFITSVSEYFDKWVEPDVEFTLNSTKSSSRPRRSKWSLLQDSLEKDAESGIDPIYEQTDAGMVIQYACGEVDNKKGVQCIPSTELGQGIMEIYDSNDNLLVDLDYQDYEQDVLRLALSSKSKTDFKKQYSDYLDSLIG